MRDGQTHRLDRPGSDHGLGGYLRFHDVHLVVVAGNDIGTHFRIAQERQILGRGPGVDLKIDDQAMSRQHASIEFDGQAFRIRDLGSTNGITVNGRVVQVSELTSGDRIEIGSQVFQYVVDEREPEPEVYELNVEE